MQLSALFPAALYLLLWKYPAQNDIVSGLRVSNRFDAKLNDAIGCFIEQVALRCSFSPDETIKAFYDKVYRKYSILSVFPIIMGL